MSLVFNSATARFVEDCYRMLQEALFKSTNDECAKQLSSFIKASKGITYFIGSGLSMLEYPSWRGLVNEFKNAFFNAGRAIDPSSVPHGPALAQCNTSDLQAIFQYFKDSDPKLYVDTIAAIFEKKPQYHRDSLINILQQKPELIVTLNFDVAIQAAAQSCGIRVSQRFFPEFRFLRQDVFGVPVVYHLHGKFHKKLYNDPDGILLHKNAYTKYYGSQSPEIYNVWMDLFLCNDIVFVGTGLQEPEMEYFFKAFQSTQSNGGIRNRYIALIPTDADSASSELDFKKMLQTEQSDDNSKETLTGIRRLRYIKRENFKGLDEVLNQAFGHNPRMPTSKTIWDN